MDIRKALSYLFDSIILSLFMSGIEIWNSSMQTKYLDRTDKFFKRAYGFRKREIKRV